MTRNVIADLVGMVWVASISDGSNVTHEGRRRRAPEYVASRKLRDATVEVYCGVRICRCGCVAPGKRI